MSICEPIVEHTLNLKANYQTMTMLPRVVVDERVLNEYHSLSITPFNFRIVMGSSRPSFMPVGCVKSISWMLGYVRNPIVSIGPEHIRRNYEQSVTWTPRCNGRRVGARCT